jgi:hypothetical protein
MKRWITIGSLLARVSQQDSGEIRCATEGDVGLTYCSTSETEGDKLLVTSQMRALGNMGFLPIAIARVDLDCPGQIFLFALSGLSAELRRALEDQGCDLVRSAKDGLS